MESSSEAPEKMERSPQRRVKPKPAAWWKEEEDRRRFSVSRLTPIKDPSKPDFADFCDKAYAEEDPFEQYWTNVVRVRFQGLSPEVMSGLKKIGKTIFSEARQYKVNWELLRERCINIYDFTHIGNCSKKWVEDILQCVWQGGFNYVERKPRNDNDK